MTPTHIIPKTHTTLPEEHPWARGARKSRRDENRTALFWLEFTNPDDGEFLGACVVPALKDNFTEAVKTAHMFKCDPGGQCAWIGVKNLERLPRAYLVRLLNEDDVKAAQAILRRARMT